MKICFLNNKCLVSFDIIIKYGNITHLIEVKKMLEYNTLVMSIFLLDFSIKFW